LVPRNMSDQPGVELRRIRALPTVLHVVIAITRRTVGSGSGAAA
jgi:hypothetical protein